MSPQKSREIDCIKKRIAEREDDGLIISDGGAASVFRHIRI